MRLAATPREIDDWQDQFAHLPEDRRRGVVRWLSEVLDDCPACDGPVRYCDPKVQQGGRLHHLTCHRPEGSMP